MFSGINYPSFMIRKFLVLFSFLLSSLNIIAQDVSIGGWKEHLSYKSGISVTEGNGKVYCATKGGIFAVNKGDNSIERLSKVSGLSDVEATVLNFNPFNNKLLIAYKNSNIDIISNGTVTNISDIKRKSIIGNKAINNIYFVGQLAYLACGFGIVVIDMERLEVKDTYYIGPSGVAINVTDITSDAGNFYASTSTGIFSAPQNSNLANFINWVKMPGLRTAMYNTVAYFNGKLYTNFSKFLTNGTMNQDTLFVNDLSLPGWSYYHPDSAETTYLIRQKNDQLIIVQEGSTTIGANVHTVYFSASASPKSATTDNAGNSWIADSNYGLVKYNSSTGYNSLYPNGPTTQNLLNMTISESNLWVAPGKNGIYYYAGGEWKDLKTDYPGYLNLNDNYDFQNVIIDPNNPRHVYATVWDLGVIEFYNDVPVLLYGKENSTLVGIHYPGGFDPIWLGGMAFDASNNLWIADNGITSSIAIKNAGGTWSWIDFSYLGNYPSVQILGKLLIDKNDQKWMIISKFGEGLVVYKAGTTETANATNTKKLSTAAGNGALPSLTVLDIAEDKDGEIWIGTDKGIAVFYSPENAFTGQNFDAQQILIEQDGHVQILLETEAIQAIAVDDANRKWIGTSRSGVFLMSADGTKEIIHFDVDNSPLLSNNVKFISIDHITGEVYFGTDKGIISLRGTSIQGQEHFDEVYSFPNPVKPDYTGPIAIKGLIDNTIIKITDISGTLVYETKSEGGQAIWYGKNFNGEKVSSGVYMVFCASEDGSEKIATKILLIN